MSPEISIIVPVYNVENYLSKCIESILNQTFKNFELILVNDGSTDLSGKICDNYAVKDMRVNVIHKENGGLSSARNSALKIIKGRYVAFVDSDDYIEKDIYQILYNSCVQTKSDIGICKFRREVNGILDRIDDGNETIELDNIEALKELFKGNLYRFSVCNKLFNKECFKDVKFPEGRIHEDLSTTYKLFANAKKAVFQNYSGYIYVKRANSILTTKYNEKRLEIFKGWDEIIQFMIKKYPELTEDVIECFVYSCIDHIYYIANQVELKKLQIKYLNIVKIYVRKYYKYIIKNNKLSISNKIRINLINTNIYLFLKLNLIKNAM